VGELSLMPWQHATSGLCRDAAKAWLIAHNRSVKEVYTVEEAGVFYTVDGYPRDVARHQRWRVDQRDLDTLVPLGHAEKGWPALA
jgi:hypothetical protein